VQDVWKGDPRARRLERWAGRSPSLLEASPGDHAAPRQGTAVTSQSAAQRRGRSPTRAPDLGDLVVVLLAGCLAGLRDRLIQDGYHRAAEVVADLVDVTDDYLTRWPFPPETR
jgi:hypothetical protein